MGLLACRQGLHAISYRVFEFLHARAHMVGVKERSPDEVQVGQGAHMVGWPVEDLFLGQLDDVGYVYLKAGDHA